MKADKDADTKKDVRGMEPLDVSEDRSLTVRPLRWPKGRAEAAVPPAVIRWRARHYTQRDLAAIMGASERTVRRIEGCGGGVAWRHVCAYYRALGYRLEPRATRLGVQVLS